MSEVEVHYPDLKRGAEQQAQAQQKVSGVQSLLGEARLPSGSMGKLPGSGDVVEANETAVQNATDFLQDLDKALESIATKLDAIHDVTLKTDESYAQAMDKLKGRMG